MTISNSDYFKTLWPSYLTSDLERIQADVWDQTTYVDQVKWWLVENCDLYREKCDNFI